MRHKIKLPNQINSWLSIFKKKERRKKFKFTHSQRNTN